MTLQLETTLATRMPAGSLAEGTLLDKSIYQDWCSLCTPNRVEPDTRIRLITTEIPWYFTGPARWGTLPVCSVCAEAESTYADLFRRARLSWSRLMTAMTDHLRESAAYVYWRRDHDPEYTVPVHLFQVYRYQVLQRAHRIHLSIVDAYLKAPQERTIREEARARGFRSAVLDRMHRETIFLNRYIARLPQEQQSEASRAEFV